MKKLIDVKNLSIYEYDFDEIKNELFTMYIEHMSFCYNNDINKMSYDDIIDFAYDIKNFEKIIDKLSQYDTFYYYNDDNYSMFICYEFENDECFYKCFDVSNFEFCDFCNYNKIYKNFCDFCSMMYFINDKLNDEITKNNINNAIIEN